MVTNNLHTGTQTVVTPQIEICWCGANAKMQSWEFDQTCMGQVICDNGHTLTKYCYYHRAVCLWNNRVKLKRNSLTDDVPDTSCG